MSDREIRQLEKVKCSAQRDRNLKAEAAACNQLGELLAKSARFQEAIEEHRQELGLCQALSDVIGCAVANRKIGECYAELGSYEAALKHQRLHLDLARSVSSDIEEQRALATIGRTYLYMCDGGSVEAQRAAEEAFLQSLAIVDERLEGTVPVREVSEMRARLFLNLGFLYDTMGESGRCSQYIRKSIFIAEKSKLHEDLYRANANLASIHLRNGEHSKAIRCWEAARECARRMPDKYMESECYCSIGQTLLSLGDLSAGKRSLKKAFLLGSLQQSDRDTVRRNLKYAIRGCRLEEALSELAEGDQQGALSLYEQLGDLYCKVAAYAKAAEYYQLQLRCAEALGRPDREVAVIHVSLAATYTDLKDYKQSVQHYRAELALRKGNPHEECKTWLNMAQSVEEDGRGYEETREALSNALHCARAAGDPQLQRKALRQLLALQRRWGSAEAGGTEAELREMCAASDGESSAEEEEEESSEPLQESDLELSESEDEDLEGYEKSVPGRRRRNLWNRRNEKGETALHRAAIEGNARLVRTLLDKGHPLNPRDYCGWTPLHEACNHGHLDIVRLLLDAGALINDAGGPLCEGITPLHDALSSGNFDVAQLLIRRGASVTQKNAKGVAPLGSLQEWTRMYGKHLDQDTRRSCRETEELLRQALAGRVAVSAPLVSAPLPDSELFDAEVSQPLAAPPIYSSGRQRVSSATETSAPRTPPLRSSPPVSRRPSQEEEEELLTPLRPVKKKPRLSAPRGPAEGEELDPPLARLPESGMEAYQRAMHGLGGAKSRLLTQTLAHPESPPLPRGPAAALVPEEDYLDDDWLEDDLEELSVRKRGRHSPPDIEEVDQPDAPPTWRPAPRARKRSRQTKLTQIVDRAVVGRTKTSAHSDGPIPRVADKAAHVTPDAAPQTPPVNPALPPPIRVRVRVQENVFLIPIPHSDAGSREVSWLADEASQRYYQSFGLLPRLTLKKEGALLAPQDRILQVLQSNEEVLAEVHSWDLPPLTDRYKKACQSLATEEHVLVQKALVQQEMSACVSLCGLSLGPRALHPLFRCLKLQTSLRQLLLSGNVLGDAEVEELLGLLSTLPNLTHLDLSSNRLTHQGSGKLGAAGVAAFQRLEHLDLSLNPLGDGLSQPLAALIQRCPLLATLRLQACQLSSKFLQQHRLLLANALTGAHHLKNLCLSHNPLGSTGVELLLKTLPPGTISRLELQAVVGGDGLIMEPLVRYLSQDGCVLSHLTLSANHLTDESLRDLARCVTVCPSLTSLDLSANPKVGTSGFELLLNAVSERGREMRALDLTGCSIRGPLTGSSLDVVSSLLLDLRLGSRSLSKDDHALLSQARPAHCAILSRQHRLFLKKLP